MMNSSIKIAFLTILMALSSCATFKDTPLSPNAQNLTTDNVKELTGNYQRMAINPQERSGYYNFEDAFQCFFLRREDKILNKANISQDQLELQVINDKKIRINFLRNGETLKSVVLKGKLTNNTFDLNYRYYFIPLVVTNYFHYRKTRLTLLKNGNLNIDTYMEALANFSLFPWGKTNKSNYMEFQKIE